MTSPARDAAIELLVGAVRGGVRDLVVCPGSRSQALALVAAELERVGAIRLHVRIDERSAAFFALGLARETGRAVPVITTSGTAVANLHPALLEAHHSGVPLVAITADRPRELQDTGANQTTLQPGLFGPLIPCLELPAPVADDDLGQWADAGAAIAGAVSGVHVNFACREPLSGPIPDLAERIGSVAARDPEAQSGEGGVLVRDAGSGESSGNAVAVSTHEPPAASEPNAPAAPVWPGDDGDRRMPRHRPQGLPADLAAAIAADLAAHPQLPQRSASDVALAVDGSATCARRHDQADGRAPMNAEGASPALGAHVRPASVPIELDPVDVPRTLVVAGDGAGPIAERVARQGGWPLIAEPSSGARFGRNLVVAARELLGADSPIPGLRDAIELVIVFGHPTLTRQIPALLRRPEVRVIVVDDRSRPTLRSAAAEAGREADEHTDAVRILAFGASRLVSRVELAELREEAEEWTAAWLAASRAIEAEHVVDAPAPDIAASRSDDLRERARFGREELAISREPVTRAMLVDAVWRATWPHDRLVVAASRLIRDLDRQVGGKRIRVVANRGLAGIDGTIATALGVATGQQFGDDAKGRAGVTRLLTGDLAFAHDASSLLVGQGGEAAPRMQIIVGNDGGGSIFDGLEVAASADRAAFDRVQFTPVALDLEAIATAYGWQYRRAATRGELEAALTDGGAARVVIEVPLPRD